MKIIVTFFTLFSYDSLPREIRKPGAVDLFMGLADLIALCVCGICKEHFAEQAC